MKIVTIDDAENVILGLQDEIRFAEGLPKTRSGKIMRRLLKEIAAGGSIKGDITTLEDFSVLAGLGNYFVPLV